jgi:predicted ArsR family transcriptional regulator
MTMQPLVDAPPQVATGSRREEVLALLRATDGALSAAEVAEATGLHLNTARFHLDALVDDGLADRASEPRDEPGRPRILYSAQGPMPGPRSYALLAEMLTGLVASLKDAGPAAVEAGRAWGRHLVERTAPSERIDAAEAVRRLNSVLDAIGFQPEVRRSKKGTEVRLHHCPFREVAEKHTDVVCALHLGLMQGALSELKAPVDATSLEPFVTPQLCVARLQPGADGSR